MRSDTQTLTINVRPNEVLAFGGEGENLPRWAIGFAKAVRPGQSGWIVTTGQAEAGQGEVQTAISVDEATGTVDFRMRPAPGVEATAYARAVPNGEGTEFLFTQMQQPGVPDDVFERLVAAVGHELVALKALLEVECPRLLQDVGPGGPDAPARAPRRVAPVERRRPGGHVPLPHLAPRLRRGAGDQLPPARDPHQSVGDHPQRGGGSPRTLEREQALTSTPALRALVVLIASTVDQ
ncbi:MAG: hypothetical protein ACRDV9_08300 [Acidimicrobiia bacterium]